MELWPLAKGLATYIPGLYRPRAGAAGGAVNGRYCYAVWLRHLAMAGRHGLRSVPRVVAELGPGLSLGVGICALLSGAEEYIALDMSRDADPRQNERVLSEIVALFRERSPAPSIAELPGVLPRLEVSVIPHVVERTGVLDLPAGTRAAQVASALEAILAERDSESAVQMRYVVPWERADILGPTAVDFILAQAVMEHVQDAEATYQAVATWLKPGGFFSAAIDFRSHGLTSAWHGHWHYSSRLWRAVLGARRWGLNRLPASAHLRLLADCGFDILAVEREEALSAPRNLLSASFRELDDEDLRTAGIYVLARRRGGQ